jgi:Ca-activated chloride channel family protein
MKINPDLKGKLRDVERPTPFVSPDGRFRGWKVTLPDRLSLATPAVVNGRVFVGGGFSSYDFYAFNADDGTLAWHYQTSDDGPTAAVVEEDHVVFNTESCELEVLTVAGTPVWKKWLGDPLMSMPAAGGGRVFMAYPDSNGDRRHYMASFDLRTGKEYWKQPIEGEVITAPVLAGGHVHFSTLGGTLYRLRQDDGHVEWQESRNATSSPVVWEDECYFSQRQEVMDERSQRAAAYQTEHLSARSIKEGTYRHYIETARKADYLDHAKRKIGSPMYQASELADSSVGFSGFKGDAKMYQAMANLGKGHVHAIWAYQGSKPFVSRARLYAAQGDTVSSADPRSDHVFWKTAIGRTAGDAQELLDSVLTPPAIVNGKIFMGSVSGEIHCLCAESGAELWNVPIGEPVVFQPAVAGGRIYAGTDSGSLICIETGDPGDDGWLMWGADAAHNGRLE